MYRKNSGANCGKGFLGNWIQRFSEQSASAVRPKDFVKSPAGKTVKEIYEEIINPRCKSSQTYGIYRAYAFSDRVKSGQTSYIKF